MRDDRLDDMFLDHERYRSKTPHQHSLCQDGL